MLEPRTRKELQALRETLSRHFRIRYAWVADEAWPVHAGLVVP